jgi:hypothetical protein
MNGTWSDKEERKLVKMRAAGKSFVLIAKALGRSEASCANRWYKRKKTSGRAFPHPRRAVARRILLR